MNRILTIAALAAPLILAACSPALDANTDMAIDVVRRLSDDTMQGRAADTQGGKLARKYLVTQAKALKPGLDVREVPFEKTITRRGQSRDVVGTNIVVHIPGSSDSARNDTGPILEIGAHYDHLGIRDGEVFNGADDNASGVGALMAILADLIETPPENDTNILWFDAEELGLTGARVYVDAITDTRARAMMNLDMIAQNEAGEIYMAGSAYTPALKPIVERAAAGGTSLTVRFGHDDPSLGRDDWTSSSDHGPFHARGVPFVYYGVEDHPHYHAATDTFETLPLDTYRGAVELAVDTARELDSTLIRIAQPLSLD